MTQYSALIGVTGTYATQFDNPFQSNLSAFSLYRSSPPTMPHSVIFSTLDRVLFSAPLSPPSITLHCNTSLLSTSQSRKKIKEMLFDQFHFIVSICISGLAEVRLSLLIPMSEFSRIQMKINENLCSWLPWSQRMRSGCFRSRQAGLWKPAAWRNKTFKVLSVTLHFQPYINIAGCRARDTKNISCYLKQTALRLQLSSECWPPAWEPGKVLLYNKKKSS